MRWPFVAMLVSANALVLRTPMRGRAPPACLSSTPADPVQSWYDAGKRLTVAILPTGQREQFDQVYDLPDPRPYWAGLLPTAYRIPIVVAGAIRALSAHATEGTPLRVIDFACGHGAVGAMLRHKLKMEDIYAYYTMSDWQPDQPTKYRALDREWYRRHLLTAPSPPIEITGLDVAGRALAYAAEMGLIDAVAHENLIEAQPSDALRDKLLSTDLIVEAGAVGDEGVQFGVYRAILAMGARPVIMRIERPDVDLRDVDELLAATGYVTHTLGPTIRYRKPLGPAEAARVLKVAATLGKSAEEAMKLDFIAVRLTISCPAGVAHWPFDVSELETRCKAQGCFD
jgi:hypothetical protein